MQDYSMSQTWIFIFSSFLENLGIAFMIWNVHSDGYVICGRHDANSRINGENDTY